MNHSKFVSELSKLRSSSTFLSLMGYTNEAGEAANYNIVFHISYKNALLRSIEQLNALDVSSPLEMQAKKELLVSFNTSLLKAEETAVEDLNDGYSRFFDEEGNYIKGVKLHKDTNTLHLYGLVTHKRVMSPGVYPTKNSRPETVAKNKLRSLCSVGKFRQFKITPDKLERISVENISLLPPDSF